MRGREPRLPLESIPPSHIASPGSACRCRRHTKGSHGGARPTPAPPVASPLALLTARWLAPHTLIGSCNAMREKAHHYIGMVRENSLNILEFVPGRSIQSLLGGLGSKADYLVNSMEGHGDLLEQHGTIEVIVAVTR
uniref:Uncharacterized protein n=1 Tax=Oryza rufipogon TaxID=4529 RepID=A0A0E0QZB3_ORYRU